MSFGRGFSANAGLWRTPQGSITSGHGYYLTVVYDESGASPPELYIDGSPQTLTPVAPSGAPQDESASPLRIGNTGLGDRTFDGTITELRLAPVARTAAWIDAQYRAATDTMVTVGPEQARP